MPWLNRSGALGVGLLLLTVCDAALAKRYALLIGANRGLASDGVLRYAVDDAQGVADVLTRLGGVAPNDIVLLREPGANEVRAALSRLHRLLSLEQPGASMLFVYYSGHADAQGLHLNGTVFGMRTIAWVASSAVAGPPALAWGPTARWPSAPITPAGSKVRPRAA